MSQIIQMAPMDPVGDYAKSILAEDTRRRQIAGENLQRQIQSLALAKAQREMQDEDAYRQSLVEAAKPVTTTTRVENPSLGGYLAAHTPEALQVAQGGKFDENAEAKNFMPSEEYDQGISDLAKASGAFPQPVTETTTTAPSAWQMQFRAGQALVAKGHPKGMEILNTALGNVFNEASKLSAMGANEDAINLINQTTGSSFKFVGIKGNKKVVQNTKDGSFWLEDLDAYQRTGNPNLVMTKLSEGTPETKWRDLGVEKHGRQEVLVQQNVQTGEKKYTKLSPDVALVGDGHKDFKPQITQFVDDDGAALYWDAGSRSLRRVGTDEPARNPSTKASSTEREKTSSFKGLLDLADDINTSYKPEYVGITSGRAGAVSQLWSEDESRFRRNVKDLGDQLLRARSGAQINEQEYKRLLATVPTVNDSEKQFSGKMAGFIKMVQQIQSRRSGEAKRSGVAAPATQKTVVRTGTANGRKVIQYSDGSVEYAQ